MTPRQRATFFARLARATPEPATELTYDSPFQLLVAVILSAQTTDRAVNLATPALFATAPTPDRMAALGPKGIEPYIRTIGLYRSKAAHVAETARRLVDHHAGAVPATREALEALPGVGRKTANVVLNTAFGQPTIAVDTHIFRVANRTGMAPGKTPLAVEQALLAAVPARYRRHAHHWLILHGRYVCKARRPECERCLVADLCDYPARPQVTSPTRTPARKDAR